MAVNYKVLFDGSRSLVIAVVLTSFAIFRKWLVTFFTQVIFKMSKKSKNDSIVIEPSQNMPENLYGNYDEFDSSSISKGAEAIQKIGKEVGSIFKKNTDTE